MGKRQKAEDGARLATSTEVQLDQQKMSLQPILTISAFFLQRPMREKHFRIHTKSQMIYVQVLKLPGKDVIAFKLLEFETGAFHPADRFAARL